MTEKRVLLLGGDALGPVIIAQLQASMDARGHGVVLVSKPAPDAITEEELSLDLKEDDCRVLVIGAGGFGPVERLNLLDLEPIDCSIEDYPFDYYWGDHEEANLREPVGCSQRLVRLEATNEDSLSFPPSGCLCQAKPTACHGACMEARLRIGQTDERWETNSPLQ